MFVFLKDVTIKFPDTLVNPFFKIMKNNSRIRAFSLIELSIVILIIGIIIVGVTQGSRLISKSKLDTARSLTQSSPVSSIQNLSLWLEATSDKSFDDGEEDDGLAITNWYDISPQTSYPANFVGATTARPLYRLDAINGLPAILFDGTNDFMSTTEFASINSSSTVFLVIRTPATLSASATVFSKRVAGTDTGTNINANITNSAGNGFQYCDSVTSTGVQNCYAGGAGIAANNSYITVVVYTSNLASGISFYQNGGSALDTANTTNNAPNIASVPATTFLGKSGLTATPAFFSGHIGEIIIYDRALRDEEVSAVESYLSKKWKINIT